MSPGCIPRVAVVSGGTTGIGLATAFRLLRAGHRVAVFSHGEASVMAAGAALAEAVGPERSLARKVDLREPAAIEHFFDEVAHILGAPGILVCNAGISPKGPDGPHHVADLPLEEWNDVLTVNLTGTMLCCQAVLPAMKEMGYGRVIFVGSLAGRTRPRIAGAGYSASKAALSGLSRVLVSQYGPYGITSNVVAPGRVLTPLTGSPQSKINIEALARIPAGRLGAPDDVAAVIAFLASADAGFVNGAIIDVNGGEFAPS
ncbi:3-oxoacyl-ACP reductase FabG [Rhizobium brockwellii]|jgi:3-oxoacyl-[acyl-carrier protein] reductase|uniref:SDR family oxidoreductase n=1 Tax=Rhizobium leguminosarum TaxID=384 RepID=A0A4V2IIH4_RHILE|nr:3-oxoacyl-ACP reductase FabG [Rhizobium leguminosarum]QND17073.1 3-oxoacyl-ACP reductase FabG [Rhizobium leguminosarum bv. trifolii]TAV40865.1 SDR family oxidoreductase [Rhizobium leguminosarum]TAV41432.1 SDR family oxidoreductase [Rhizobium leguminosarum]TAV61212.1 SDR family oxidoreductase [Rhizobium leguminosarum]TAX69138.1 SDR family oxidoreductase [Rhizobium leguminosarum]